jgi:aspartyl-tRNA synthetase
MLRTHTCGQLSKENEGERVQLTGWVHRRRDHGGVIFIDLRDRYGLTQVKFDPDINQEAHKQAEALRSEWVIQVGGEVIARPDGMVNDKIKTGEIELAADEIKILSQADTLPFEIDEEKRAEVKESLRMKYRYLDLRKHEVAESLVKRNHFVNFARQYLTDLDFVEVETPMLTKSTPEGARDFLVPSRLQQGQFYALPQSPQQYKQLLMIGGMDRYFQVSKCFRDEDTRGDRQAEFTQLDIEMSFIDMEDMLNITEDMMTKAIKEVFPDKKLLSEPWPRLDYEEAMLKYGIDKPDLRFGLEIKDLTDMVKGCGFQVFSGAVENGGVVRAICATGAGGFSRAEIDELTEYVKQFGAKGLAYIVVEENNLKSPIAKFLGEDLAWNIVREMGARAGDIIFFGADKESIVCESLANLRNKLGDKLGLKDPNTIALAFVVNFPLFEQELEDGHYAPSHHMFTAPRDEDIHLLNTNPFKVRSYQYDMVANGVEVGGGSLRNHRRDVQEKIFERIGFDDNKKEEFAHFLRAFQYGVPPHGGIAPGVDRLLMILMGKDSIRDVMAFPKTGDGRDLMMEAPSQVEEKQLKELGITIKKDDE